MTLLTIWEWIKVIGMPAMLTITIMYLLWFSKTHTNEHRTILDRMDANDKRDKKIADDIDSLYKITLRGYIVNNEVPVSARLEMYDIYKAKGFNSWVDQYVEENLKRIKE